MTTTTRPDRSDPLARRSRLLAPTVVLALVVLLAGSDHSGTVEPKPPAPAAAATRSEAKESTKANEPGKDGESSKTNTPSKTTAPSKSKDPKQPNQPGEPEEPIDFRLREGTRIVDQLGHFRNTGDRIAFFAEDGTGRFIGLENLNLQRVAAVVGQQPEKRLWKVTGTITEYRGENFLLIDRVSLESWDKLPDAIP